MRFKKSTFWVTKVHFFGGAIPPKSILATGLSSSGKCKQGSKGKLYGH